MGFSPIIYRGKPIMLHKSIIEPNFNSNTILVNTTWEYIEMWLKRQNKKEALFYWEQAKNFYKASLDLPKTSSPLTTYYCFLNAVKTLLVAKGENLENRERHGVTGITINKKASLANEIVTFHSSGILTKLCKYLNEPIQQRESYTLKNLLYNLPYIHRAYTRTFTSASHLFIPILNPIFVRKDNSTESWFCAKITDNRYIRDEIIKNLTGFQQDMGVIDTNNKSIIIRKRKRFTWDENKNDETNINELKKYHKKVRQNLYYIKGTSRLWYIKRCDDNLKSLIKKSSLTITFAAMHKLSELSRYSPASLAKHFDSVHNWLLSEFITLGLEQFIDEISSEITGEEFLPPGIR